MFEKVVWNKAELRLQLKPTVLMILL